MRKLSFHVVTLQNYFENETCILLLLFLLFADRECTSMAAMKENVDIACYFITKHSWKGK